MQEARPPYVSFVRRAVEDGGNGRRHFKDVDFARITPAGQKDIIEMTAEAWVAYILKEERDGRVPRGWAEQYERMYEAWKKGEELPENGIPIKGWPVLSPAQQATVLSVNIRTVEDLAAANEEAIRGMGPGGVTMKQTAEAWLKEATDKAGNAEEMATLKRDNAALKLQVEELMARVDELRPKQGKATAVF